MTGSRRNELPICFTRNDALSILGGTSAALDSWIKRALKRDELLLLKKGLYLNARTYMYEPDKTSLAEFLASKIYGPSYISLEYALEKYGVFLPSGHIISPITSITPKTNRTFSNVVGTFTYSNMKPQLCSLGLQEIILHGHAYAIATKAKALFDYCYLHSELPRRNAKKLKDKLFRELGIQWNNVSDVDFEEFGRYVWKSNSAKMIHVWEVLNTYFEKKKIDAEFALWRKELLG